MEFGMIQCQSHLTTVFTASPTLSCSHSIWLRPWRRLPPDCRLPVHWVSAATRPHTYPAFPSGYLKSQTSFNLHRLKESNFFAIGKPAECALSWWTIIKQGVASKEEFSLVVSRTVDWREQSQGELRDLAVSCGHGIFPVEILASL